jgi:hypothetical protein
MGTYSLDQKGQLSNDSGAGFLGQNSRTADTGIRGMFTNIATGRSTLTSSLSASSTDFPWMWVAIAGGIVGLVWLWKRHKK